MRASKTYRINDEQLIRRNMLFWAQQFEQHCLLESNAISTRGPSPDQYSSFDCIVAVGAHSKLHAAGIDDFGRLKSYVDETGDWIFGYLAYDLKNQIENLSSANTDYLDFLEMHFFQPEIIGELSKGQLKLSYLQSVKTEQEIDAVFDAILGEVPCSEETPLVEVEARITREEYLDSVEGLKTHISYGDIYEVNFCQEFYCENAVIDPLPLYEKLNTISNAPFSTFYRNGAQYLLSASPERFLKKSGKTLLSQPIKGTKRRGESGDLDILYKDDLAKSEKEKSENVMIVDLVRNDLSRSAVKGTVEVEELFGIYTFEQVHHMISTVKCKIREDVHPVDALIGAFPMGSMTGAPKIRAMKLIEEYESTKRGLYSGAVGYFTPDGDFDFSVVIRSILYNAQNNYLSFMVGGAITDKSEPTEEYEECLIKARAIFDVLNVKESVH